MKISKRTIIIIILVAIICVLIAVIIFLNSSKSNRNQTVPVKSLLEATTGTSTLSSEGVAVKNNLVAGLGSEGGVLLTTQDMEIGYLPPPYESIMVFVLGVDVEKVEQDALSWLVSRGFSEADICHLPVIFSAVNPDAQTKEAYKLSMNYVPEFCSEVLGVE